MARDRILFVLPSLVGGGAERVMLTLLGNLDRARFEPHLALLEAAGPYLQDVPGDVPVHDLKASRVRTAIPGLVRLTRRLRPRAALSTLAELNLALAFARPFLPRGCALVLREAITPSARLREISRHPGLWRWLYRRLYRRADAVVCVSDAVLNDLAEQFQLPRNHLVRIYNPVDVARLRELAAGANPYSGPGAQLVAAGRLHAQKGYDVLLEAVARAVRVIPALRLTILGEGPLEAALKAQAQRLGLSSAVHFAGFQANPYPFLKHADLFVLASRYEGLPNVLLEALAVGTRAVATDAPGGAREILQGCPLGRLVPAGDASALARAIVEMLQAGPEGRGEPDVQLCLERFRVERVVRQYEEILSAPARPRP